MGNNVSEQYCRTHRQDEIHGRTLGELSWIDCRHARATRARPSLLLPTGPLLSPSALCCPSVHCRPPPPLAVYLPPLLPTYHVLPSSVPCPLPRPAAPACPLPLTCTLPPPPAPCRPYLQAPKRYMNATYSPSLLN